MKTHQILLYYCYSNIEDPAEFRLNHHEFCIDLDLRGRIIVAAEGINGTVSGTIENCSKYMEHLKADPRFADTEFKIDSSDGHAFQKLNVRLKKEIVHSSLEHINPRKRTGKYVEPEEFIKLSKNPDYVVLDVRSNYEHELGRFKNAITLDIDHFRDFPEKIKELENLKNKKIVTYCTGGVKCEKASAYLLENGFHDVYQLHGGIIKYGMEAGGEDFEGKCYVFDNRVALDVNKVNPKIISKCYICEKPSDRMVNCANPECNIHVAICDSCGDEYQGACSEDCMNHPEKREYDGTGYYAKTLNGYNPKKDLKRKEVFNP
ncbi:MAG: rhodanese-related sulfurtransferase [Cytophagales bacterium]